MKRDKSAIVGLVICFVAMITIVGAVVFSNYGKKSKEELENTDENIQAELEKETTEEDEFTQITQGDNIQAELEISDVPIMEQADLSFQEDDKLIWPVDGNVLMNYSMDQTIYFATLDQYKYNPAIIIEGQVGQDVRAVKEGEVLLIETHAETGNTVTLDLGNGYQAVYGQLREVLVTPGERISQGDLIGYLAEPTKYYTVEGCNLYFQLLKEGEPVNPLEYLES